MEGMTYEITNGLAFGGISGQFTYPNLNFRARAGLLRFKQTHLFPTRALSLTSRSIVHSS